MAQVLHARSDNFDERNPLTHLVLGLLSLSRRLDALLIAHPGEPGAAEDAHPWDDALLGLLAVRARILGHLEAGCPEPDLPDAAAPVTARGRPREVLR